MEFCYSQAMIHALTCSYSLQQMESENERGFEVVGVEQHRQNDDSIFPKNLSAKSTIQGIRAATGVNRFSSASSCRSRPSAIHNCHRNLSTGSVPPTIQEDLIMEDLVLESRDWLLNSLLDVEQSKSDE